AVSRSRSAARRTARLPSIAPSILRATGSISPRAATKSQKRRRRPKSPKPSPKLSLLKRSDALRLAAGVMAFAAAPARAQTPGLVPIRVGAINIESAAEGYYADEMG